MYFPDEIFNIIKEFLIGIPFTVKRPDHNLIVHGFKDSNGYVIFNFNNWYNSKGFRTYLAVSFRNYRHVYTKKWSDDGELVEDEESTWNYFKRYKQEGYVQWPLKDQY